MPTVRLEDRAVLRVAGVDARAFLQGLVTADIDVLAADRPLYAGLLSPQGKALFDFLLFDGGDGAVLIDVAAGRAALLAKRLAMYRLRKAVEIAPVDAAVHAAWGGEGEGKRIDPRLAELGARWIGAASAAAGAGADAYDAHRLARGVPGSIDIGSDELLWLETSADLLHGVSFTKGCYVGQENTARMHHRDKVRRRLLPVRFAGDPGDGTITDARGRTAGSLRTHRDGVGIAHLRVETTAGPLQMNGAPLELLRPSWLAGTLDDVAA